MVVMDFLWRIVLCPLHETTGPKKTILIHLDKAGQPELDVSAQVSEEELETSASYGHEHYHHPDDYHGGHHSQSEHHQPHTHSQSYSHSQAGDK